MKDEVYIKLDADTLRMIHEENMTHLKTFDDEIFYKVDKALYGQRLTTLLVGRSGRGSKRSWTQAEQDRQLSVHGSRKFHPTCACGR